MILDINTLFFLTMYIEAILGLLLFLAWVQNLHTRALAWWGGAHLMRSMSVALYGLYGSVPAAISIDLAGVLLFASFGLTWAGTRVFDGRSAHPGWLLSGAVAWVLACQVPGFADNVALRNALSAIIIAGFSFAAAAELWRGRSEALVSRVPAVVLLAAHGGLFLLRTPLTTMLPDASHQLASAWLTVLSAEALLFTIAIAFVLLAMGKERMEQSQKTLAMLDPLTGLPNRRGFLHSAEIITRNQVIRARPVAVFIVDLDHFKAINDRFGHAMGDRVLKVFAEMCGDNLRSTDLVGRLGGEEFAVLLADATRDNAFLVAERIRTAFEVAATVVDGQRIDATLSVGVAIIQDSEQNLSLLLKQADQALYRAKQRGRNRTELAPLDTPDWSDSAKTALAEQAAANLRA